MKKILIYINSSLGVLGFNLMTFYHFCRNFPFYLSDYKKIKKQKGKNTDFEFGQKTPMLGERFSESGTMSGHYFHQDLIVAKKIFNRNPKRHVDIGSRVDGFVSHVAVFRQIEIVDIRHNISNVSNISFLQADLMEMPNNLYDYCDSISALHSVEHFGLGRYGDPIDYFGHIKAIENIHKILQTGGIFYFSVPIGKQRIEFNALRVFSIPYLLKLFEGKFSVASFSYVNDKGLLFENIELKGKDYISNFDCYYGCGIFELTKI
jgi:SAM-dependent methyltransferase